MSNVLGWSLVAVAAGLGVVACIIFAKSLAVPIAHIVVKIFI